VLTVDVIHAADAKHAGKPRSWGFNAVEVEP